MLYIEDQRRAKRTLLSEFTFQCQVRQTITIEGDNDCKEVNGNQLSALVIQPGIVREGCTQGRLH